MNQLMKELKAQIDRGEVDKYIYKATTLEPIGCSYLTDTVVTNGEVTRYYLPLTKQNT